MVRKFGIFMSASFGLFPAWICAQTGDTSSVSESISSSLSSPEAPGKKSPQEKVVLFSEGGTEKIEEKAGSSLRQSVQQTLAAHIDEMVECAELLKQKSGSLQEKVKVSFTIGAGGVVQNAKVVSGIQKYREVQDCVVQKLQTWKFPDPGEGKTLRWTHNFVLTVQKTAPQNKK